MGKMNIKIYVNLLIIAGLFMYSCSNGDDIIPGPGPDPDNNEPKTTLSILLDGSDQEGLKTSGNPDLDAEKKIYSLEVLVFKANGDRDGYKSAKRLIINAPTGLSYDKEYKEINEITGVELTAGKKRDIYVIANAPDDYFANAKTYGDFIKLYEKLSTQGRRPHPGTTTGGDNDLPIGGVKPSDLKTNLTMCGLIKNVDFNNLYDQHYLGYTTNNGRPPGVNTGYVLNGTNEFSVERLVARVAVKQIAFDLPASLPFEGATLKSDDYTYQIDTVFMMNVKTTSKFVSESELKFTEEYGQGNNPGYSFLNANNHITDLNTTNKYTDYLFEAITTPYYDITISSTPLWFYTFENEEQSGSTIYPTYLVIGVRYNFKSAIDNKTFKTLKCYYPVIINAPKVGKLVSHDYIKRNYQYQIIATIKGLGSMYGTPALLKASQEADQSIEITETVGQNLFPWTGNTYR